MKTHEFDLILDRFATDEEVDALWGEGCDDCTPGLGGSCPPDIAFHREASSLIGAVISAIDQVESLTGLRVVGLDADPLVTIQDIAERTGRTRESVRLLINGQRGPGGFPQPALGSAPRRRLWRWSEVAAWPHEDIAEVAETAIVSQAINGWLGLRATIPKLAPPLHAVGEALTEATAAA
jgi:predicted DNA-binding transcriptional regulator AlpA